MLSGPGVDRLFHQQQKVETILDQHGFKSNEKDLIELLASECDGFAGQSPLKRGECGFFFFFFRFFCFFSFLFFSFLFFSFLFFSFPPRPAPPSRAITLWRRSAAWPPSFFSFLIFL